jgi:hypothetical protein
MTVTKEQIAQIRAERTKQLILMAIDAIKTGNYSILSLAGRYANASELDSGKLYHAVVDNRMAICGQEPGRHSAGWSDYVPPSQTVTCPRCLKKLNKEPK